MKLDGATVSRIWRAVRSAISSCRRLAPRRFVVAASHASVRSTGNMSVEIEGEDVTVGSTKAFIMGQGARAWLRTNLIGRPYAYVSAAPSSACDASSSRFGGRDCKVHIPIEESLRQRCRRQPAVTSDMATWTERSKGSGARFSSGVATAPVVVSEGKLA
jgi:hypothetical protein